MANPSSQTSHRQMLLVLALLISNISHVLDFVIMMPLAPLMMADFNISAVKFGYIVSVYTFAAAISSFASSFWIESVNRKRALLGLLIGFALGNFVCAQSTSAEQLIIGRLVAGGFGGVISAIVYSIIGELIPLDVRGRVTGIIGMSFPLVSILGVPASLAIADIYGWRLAFIFVLIMSFISMFLVTLFIPTIIPNASGFKLKRFFVPVQNAFRYSNHHLGFLTVVLTVLGGFTLVPYIAPFLINHQYIENSDLSLVYLVGGICSMVSSRYIGIWADKSGKIYVLRWVLIATMLAIAFFTNLPEGSFALVLVAVSCMTMFLPGRFVCVISYLTIIADPKNRSTYMSLVSTLQQMAIGIATIIGGNLVGENANGNFETFWLVGLFAIGSNAIILAMTPKLAALEQTAMTAARQASQHNA